MRSSSSSVVAVVFVVVVVVVVDVLECEPRLVSVAINSPAFVSPRLEFTKCAFLALCLNLSRLIVFVGTTLALAKLQYSLHWVS